MNGMAGSKRDLRPRMRGSRPIFWRLYHLHQAIRSGRCPSLAELAKELGYSERTIERDLQQLRDLYAPLVYDRVRGGYRYEGDYRLPRVKLTAGELAVLLIGQRLLSELAGTPFAAAARRVMEKLPFILGEELSVEADPFGEEISFGLPRVRGDQDRLNRHFNLLAEAVAERRTVRMVYHALTRDAVTEREVDPYHLRLEAGAWYAIGYCHLRRDLRIFAVDRIKELALTGRTFERASDFTIRQYLGLSWGIEKGPEYTVRVAFDADQARWVRERVWHETQRLVEIPGGGVILEARVSGLESIKRWILGFGRHARVLEPPELIRMILEDAEGILRESAGEE